jgi:hypothetical protein
MEKYLNYIHICVLGCGCSLKDENKDIEGGDNDDSN